MGGIENSTKKRKSNWIPPRTKPSLIANDQRQTRSCGRLSAIAVPEQGKPETDTNNVVKMRQRLYTNLLSKFPGGFHRFNLP